MQFKNSELAKFERSFDRIKKLWDIKNEEEKEDFKQKQETLKLFYDFMESEISKDYLNEERKFVKEQINQMQISIETLYDELKISEKENSELSNENKKLKDDLLSLNKKHDLNKACDRQNDSLIVENSKLKKDIKNLNKEIENLKKEIENIKSNVVMYKSQINRNGRTPKNVDIPKLLELRNKGKSLRDIGEYFGVSKNTIKNRLDSIKNNELVDTVKNNKNNEIEVFTELSKNVKSGNISMAQAFNKLETLGFDVMKFNNFHKQNN